MDVGVVEDAAGHLEAMIVGRARAQKSLYRKILNSLQKGALEATAAGGNPGLPSNDDNNRNRVNQIQEIPLLVDPLQPRTRLCLPSHSPMHLDNIHPGNSDSVQSLRPPRPLRLLKLNQVLPLSHMIWILHHA